MEYTCILRHGFRKEIWTGTLTLLRKGSGQYKAEISGLGTYFHVLAGRYKYGNYLCIPNHDVGDELSDFSDIFRNEERLCGLMRKADAVTVPQGWRICLPWMMKTFKRFRISHGRGDRNGIRSPLYFRECIFSVLFLFILYTHLL